MDHFHYRDGVMHAEEAALTHLAEAVGTPTYVYSAATVERHLRVFADALAPLADPLVCYAVKANPNAAILRLVARSGGGADVVSGGELRRALAAGIAPAKIVFSGVGKTAEEMALGLHEGIGQFNLESEEEAETLGAIATAIGTTARVAYRINPDVEAGTHAKITTGRSDNKFGIPLALARDACRRAAALQGIAVQGVAVHIGSQLTDLAPLEAAFTRLGGLIADLRADGHDLRTADLGGGLGVPYDPDRSAPPLPALYGAMVARVAGGWGLRLIFEPGRLIVGNAGILLARVIRVKPGAQHPFVIVDAGMNDLMRPALYDAWHGIRAVVPRSDRFTANIVGPVCETGDTFATARAMDRVEAGDLVAFMTAGAYAATMASTYNSRPLTPEVMVSGNQWALVRERLPVEALMAAERLPPWLEGAR